MGAKALSKGKGEKKPNLMILDGDFILVLDCNSNALAVGNGAVAIALPKGNGEK